jgi:hypothetical protein
MARPERLELPTLWFEAGGPNLQELAGTEPNQPTLVSCSNTVQVTYPLVFRFFSQIAPFCRDLYDILMTLGWAELELGTMSLVTSVAVLATLPSIICSRVDVQLENLALRPQIVKSACFNAQGRNAPINVNRSSALSLAVPHLV